MLLDAKGNVLDSALRDRSVKGVSEWIDEINSGNSQAALEKKLKNEPENPELLLNLSKKLEDSELEKKESLLEKIFTIKKDIPENILQESAKELLKLYEYHIINEEKNKIELLKKYDPYVTKTLYPLLKDSTSFSDKLSWENTNSRFENVIKMFKANIPSEKLSERMMANKKAVIAYLNLNQFSQADNLIETSIELVISTENPDVISLFEIYSMANHKCEYLNNNENSRNKAEKYAGQLYDFYLKSSKTDTFDGNTKMMAPYYLREYSREYGLVLDRYFKSLDKQIASQAPEKSINSRLEKGELLFKFRNKEEGKTLFLSYLNDTSLMEKLNSSQKSGFLNSIAWILYEQKMVDEHVLEIANKSVQLEKNAANLDTLACILSVLGNYVDAVTYEKEGLSLLTDKQPMQKKQYQENINTWSKQIIN